MRRFSILRQIEVMSFFVGRFWGVLVFVAVSFSAVGQHKVDPTHEFMISGMVEHEITLDIAAIKKYPATDLGEVVVKSHRGEEKHVAKNVKGVLLKTLMESMKVKISKPKEYSQLVVVLIASDGYKNVYSWNELFNTEVGNHVYVITEKDGQTIDTMDGAIVVVSTTDINAGARYLKGLQRVDIRKIE